MNIICRRSQRWKGSVDQQIWLIILHSWLCCWPGKHLHLSFLGPQARRHKWKRRGFCLRLCDHDHRCWHSFCLHGTLPRPIYRPQPHSSLWKAGTSVKSIWMGYGWGHKHHRCLPKCNNGMVFVLLGNRTTNRASLDWLQNHWMFQRDFLWKVWDTWWWRLYWMAKTIDMGVLSMSTGDLDYHMPSPCWWRKKLRKNCLFHCHCTVHWISHTVNLQFDSAPWEGSCRFLFIWLWR